MKGGSVSQSVTDPGGPAPVCGTSWLLCRKIGGARTLIGLEQAKGGKGELKVCLGLEVLACGGFFEALKK